MNILMIADVVARPGRRAVLDNIQSLREQYKIDVATMNCENVWYNFNQAKKFFLQSSLPDTLIIEPTLELSDG